MNNYKVKVRGWFIATVDVKATSETTALKDYKVRFPSFDDLTEFAADDVLKVELQRPVKRKASKV